MYQSNQVVLQNILRDITSWNWPYIDVHIFNRVNLHKVLWDWTSVLVECRFPLRKICSVQYSAPLNFAQWKNKLPFSGNDLNNRKNRNYQNNGYYRCTANYRKNWNYLKKSENRKNRKNNLITGSMVVLPQLWKTSYLIWSQKKTLLYPVGTFGTLTCIYWLWVILKVWISILSRPTIDLCICHTCLSVSIQIAV